MFTVKLLERDLPEKKNCLDLLESWSYAKNPARGNYPLISRMVLTMIWAWHMLSS
jgi:hypothetical protein